MTLVTSFQKGCQIRSIKSLRWIIDKYIAIDYYYGDDQAAIEQLIHSQQP